VLLLLVRIGGDLADQILAASDRVSVVQDVALEVGLANGQLTGESLQKSGLA
jgi:hypothetical protein